MKEFQDQRRAKRREQLPRMLDDQLARFKDLNKAILGSDRIWGITDLARKLRSVEEAVKVAKRYNQLAEEAKLLGLNPPPAPKLDPKIEEAYVTIVGRNPRAGKRRKDQEQVKG